MANATVTGSEVLEKVAAELRASGWAARVDGGYLRVAEAPALRSPEIRGERLVWGERSWSKAPTLAARLDAFLRSGPAPRVPSGSRA